MNQKWQNEIDNWCEEIKQIDDAMKLELLTEGLTERWSILHDVKRELLDNIAVTVYTDWQLK